MKNGTRQTIEGTVLEAHPYRNAAGRFCLSLLIRTASDETGARRVLLRGKYAYAARTARPGDSITAYGRTYRARCGKD